MSRRLMVPLVFFALTALASGCIPEPRPAAGPLPESPQAAVRRFVEASAAGDAAVLQQVTAANPLGQRMIASISAALSAERALAATGDSQLAGMPRLAGFLTAASVAAIDAPALLLVPPERLDELQYRDGETGEVHVIAEVLANGQPVATVRPVDGGWKITVGGDAERTPPAWQETAIAAFDRLAADLRPLAKEARREGLDSGKVQRAAAAFTASPEMNAFNRMLVEASRSKDFALP